MTRATVITNWIENVGRGTVRGLEELGYVAALLFESLYWLVRGRSRKQPVRMPSLFHEAMQIGVKAIPICAVLSFSIGVMLAIQGIESLKTFGAEAQVILGIALSISREFSPLIIGILIAGRSGSAIAARLGTMHESQEIDALRVMGVNPIRYLASPILIALIIMMPMLTILGNVMGMLGGAVYTNIELNISYTTYADRTLEILSIYDIMQGIIKSIVFAIIIALVGLSNGFQVNGGAEGVGRATTRAVVLSITYIVIADMIFTYFLNR